MYQVLKNWLTGGKTYTVTDAKDRIDYHVARGRITTAEAAELLQVAEAGGTEDPVTTEMLTALTARIDMLEDCIAEMAMLVYASAAV